MDVPCLSGVKPTFLNSVRSAHSFFLNCALAKTERVVYLRPNWPVRPGVRTPGFHPGNRGSIPLRATEAPASH